MDHMQGINMGQANSDSNKAPVPFIFLEVDSHINDRLFAERATDLLDELMHKVA
ncbi:MAG: hypothetical protein JRD02_03015 [Deltaproteobacteria bacterium]|nr:hypothetical protein [Deltaproteobacteria bacterium]